MLSSTQTQQRTRLMAWDRSESILHLTLSGWQTGESPEGRVESWHYSYSQQSGWSKEYVEWTCIWADPDIPRADRNRIREQYGERMGKPGRFGNVITTISKPL
jgi:hypothetical protein